MIILMILYVLILCVSIGIVCIIFYFFFWELKSVFIGYRVPYVNSFSSALSVLVKGIQLEPGKKIVDLGSGDGKVLRFIMRNYKLSSAVGYDLNNFAINYGKFKNKIFKMQNIQLIKQDFIKDKPNLQEFDYIYLYLLPKFMASFEDWIFAHIRQDAIIISNSFEFTDHKPFNIIYNLQNKKQFFLYRN